MEDNQNLIDTLIKKENYAIKYWEPRRLNPSAPDVIFELESITNDFLKQLKSVHLNQKLSKEQKKTKIQALVDDLPWLDFDTEEREFLADIIAPAIEFVGFNPWSII